MLDFKFIGEKFSNENVYVEACEFEDSIRLQKIYVKASHRNQGYGTKVIKELIAYADKQNKILVLYAEPKDKGWPLKRLMDFYKRFGFVENKGEFFIKRFQYDNMYRTPFVS